MRFLHIAQKCGKLFYMGYFSIVSHETVVKCAENGGFVTKIDEKRMFHVKQ